MNESKKKATNIEKLRKKSVGMRHDRLSSRKRKGDQGWSEW